MMAITSAITLPFSANAQPVVTQAGILNEIVQTWTLPKGDRIPPILEFCIVRESHLNTAMTAKYPL
ncbi:MAG: hypothetical protein ACSLEM_01910 [Candidatus Malihini olakiniferum]